MPTLIVGDSHGSIAMLREAARIAQHLDASTVLSVGDFGVAPGNWGREFLDAVQGIAKARNLTFRVSPGNHDDYDQLSAAARDSDGWRVLRPQVLAADRGTLWVDPDEGLSWLMCGGAMSIDGPGGVPAWQRRGPLAEGRTITDGFGRDKFYPAGHDLGQWWPQERITEDDVLRSEQAADGAAASGHPVDVLVTHDVPSAIDLTGPKSSLPEAVHQRHLLQRLADHVKAPLGVAGHWHRWHYGRMPHGGYQVVLSADVNPYERQWLVVEGTPGNPEPVPPHPWDETVALTREKVSRHRVALDRVNDALA